MKKLLLFVLCSASLIGLTWSPPSTISTAGASASLPKIGMDSSGNVVAVWLEGTTVVARTLPISGSWSASSTSISNSGADSAQLVVAPNGTATALWLESGAAKTSTAAWGGSWSSATTLASSGASSPTLAIDASGNVVAMWIQGTKIATMTKLAGGSWSAVTTFTCTAPSNPSAAIGSNGTVVAVWTDVINSVSTVYSATTLISGSWGASAAISTAGQNSSYPKIAVNSSGNALAAWVRWTPSGAFYSNVICQVASRPVSGSWTAPTDFSDTPGIQIPVDVRVGLDNNGNGLVVWSISTDGSSYALLYSVQPVNSAWTTVSYIVGNNLTQCNLDVNQNSDGQCRIILLGYNNMNFRLEIYATGLFLGAYFPGQITPPAVLSTNANNAKPKITSVTSGSSRYNAAIWASYNGTNTIIQASSGTDAVLAAPTNLAVSQSAVNYGVFQTYRNTLSWTAVSGANSYAIMRNGVFVAQVYTPPYIDYNQTQSQAVAYGVAALQGISSQSPTSFVTGP